MKRQLMLAAAVLAAGSAFGLMSPAQAHGNGYDDRPPPPRHEVRPAPRPGKVWVPGHYDRVQGNYASARRLLPGGAPRLPLCAGPLGAEPPRLGEASRVLGALSVAIEMETGRTMGIVVRPVFPFRFPFLFLFRQSVHWAFQPSSPGRWGVSPRRWVASRAPPPLTPSITFLRRWDFTLILFLH